MKIFIIIRTICYLFFYFYFYLYIYPPDSQESDGGAIHRVSNYPDLLSEMPRYCKKLQDNPIIKEVYLNFFSATNKSGNILNIYSHTLALNRYSIIVIKLFLVFTLVFSDHFELSSLSTLIKPFSPKKVITNKANKFLL